jgi:hypothetical protein
MNKENYKSIKSLPDGVDEIIKQVQSNSTLTNALQNNKQFFEDFTSLLSDLNKLVDEKKETPHRYSQISLF